MSNASDRCENDDDRCVCVIKEGKLICEFCKVIDGGVGGTGKKCVMFVMSEGDK